MRLGLLARGALALLVTTLAGCKAFDSTCKDDDRECFSAGVFAKGLGGICDRDADCKDGLFCVSGACGFKGDTARGEKCRLSDECEGDSYCHSERKCRAAGDGEDGDPCATSGECGKGLVCAAPASLASLNLDSLQSVATNLGTCMPEGSGEQGSECDSNADCLGGLSCVPIDDVTRCQSIPSPVELPALPLLWTGVDCPEETDDKRALFQVPRSGESQEFYSLPFPNDIRRRGGHIDLSGHPLPPSDLGLPFVERYVDASSEDLDGFSTNPVVFFRFSEAYDFRSVTGDSVRIVNITQGSPDYDQPASIEWKNTEGRVSNYVCPHWLAMRRPIGEPLRPGTTYAAIVTTGLRNCPEKDDEENCINTSGFSRSPDLSALLSSSAPSDSDLDDAYTAYAPLRAWIRDTGLNADNILNATVFTTQNATSVIPGMRQRIHDNGVPTITNLTSCDAGSSPCQVGDRGACSGGSSDYTELHGRIRLPIFQSGTRPYLKPEDGGRIELDGDGMPSITGSEDVCFAMAVPSADPPAGGYPVLIYSHGTGGSFTGQMGPGGLAEAMASASTPVVTIAFDMPQHGERRGGSDRDPEELFYNFFNPPAARDNVLQGSADIMTVVHWATQGGLPDGSPVGAVPLDASHIALMGHSQGATHTALVVSYEPDVIAAVLSGVGGHLATSLMTKTSPVDIAQVIPFGVLDPNDDFELSGDAYNPALAIIQGYVERADPINYGRYVYREPTELSPDGLNLFMTYGVGDTYSPEPTQTAYARAAFLPQVGPVLVDLDLRTETAPLSGNETPGDVARTVGMRQYRPTGDTDGHFVATRSGQDGVPDVRRFLEQALAGDTPEIGQ